MLLSMKGRDKCAVVTMIDGMGERRMLQASSNQLGHAPVTRRSKNGFRASTVSCLNAPGLRIAKNCSASRCPELRLMRIRVQQKRRLSRLFDTLDCSDRSAERCWPGSVQRQNFLEPGARFSLQPLFVKPLLPQLRWFVPGILREPRRAPKARSYALWRKSGRRCTRTPPKRTKG